eukprot:UN27368
MIYVFKTISLKDRWKLLLSPSIQQTNFRILMMESFIRQVQHFFVLYWLDEFIKSIEQVMQISPKIILIIPKII